MAEVRKRGKDFWAEFEFYLSDLLVGSTPGWDGWTPAST